VFAHVPAQDAQGGNVAHDVVVACSSEANLARLPAMSADWNDNAPIYRQLKSRVVEMMLDGVLGPGDPLPSVRQIAADFQLNPITVSRAYQELADDALVEKRRGLGMYVTEGAREKLLDSERKRFLIEEWPVVIERMTRLGLNASDLLAQARLTPGGAK
jgi:GntR family transcriptional regulator